MTKLKFDDGHEWKKVVSDKLGRGYARCKLMRRQENVDEVDGASRWVAGASLRRRNKNGAGDHDGGTRVRLVRR